MSNHKSYGNHPSKVGRASSPWSSTCVLDVRPPREDNVARMMEVAEGLMRKHPEMTEDYAIEKAAEMMDNRDELF